MIGHGHVGCVDLRQIQVPGGQTAKLLDPLGRDVWVRISSNLAAQIGQGTGLFLANKESEAQTGAQRVQIIMEEKVIPLGAEQALWIFNSNAQTPVYVWVEFWNQEPPEAKAEAG